MTEDFNHGRTGGLTTGLHAIAKEMASLKNTGELSVDDVAADIHLNGSAWACDFLIALGAQLDRLNRKAVA